MRGRNQLVLVCSLTLGSAVLCLLYIFQMEPFSSPFIQERITDHRYDSSFFFSITLLVLLVIIFVKRKKIFRVAVGSILGLSSYFCWFSASNGWPVYDVSPYEQKIIAVTLLGISFWMLVSKSFKEKRKHFTEAVRREVIRNQKGKCARCKRKLTPYGFDLDHRNNNPSNNKSSNCQVLCTICHRRKHSVK
jgi:hypothetical protein